MVAVGLMYRKGYFRQRIDGGGWQHEYWIDTDPQRLPAALVTDESGEPLTVTVPIYDADVVAQIWRVDVGRVPLFLLDTERPENGPLERWITARLYVADERTRLSQYILLGVGGVRALRALGIEPAVVHLNEGHAALAPLELAGEGLRTGESLEDALQAAKSRTVFTTHTPVPAGNDTYPGDEVAAGDRPPRRGAVDSRRGRHRAGPDEPRGPRPAVRRDAGGAAAQPRRQRRQPPPWRGGARDVARAVARPAVDEVPIGYVTNGAHFPTWVGTPMRELLDRHLGAGWLDRAADRDAVVGGRSDLRRRAVGGARAPARRARRRSSASAAPKTAWLAATRSSTSRRPPGRSIPTC